MWSSGQAQAPPSYPPTEVRRWLTCPVFRDYSARWESRVEVWTPHKLVGTAIHAGVATALRNIMGNGQSNSPAVDPVQSAYEVLKAGYVQQETWGVEGLEAHVKKGVRALVQAVEGNLLEGAHVVAVEYADPGPLPPGVHVPRRVDCVLDRQGFLEVWDWKSKMHSAAQYWEETTQAVRHSWQLLDYAWHVQQWFQKPVSRVGHGLVVLSPKIKVEFLPVPVTQERLIQWRKDAETIWRLMGSGLQPDSGVLVPASDTPPTLWHNWEACTDRHLHYGKRCVYFEACHDLCGDEGAFLALYKEKTA